MGAWFPLPRCAHRPRLGHFGHPLRRPGMSGFVRSVTAGFSLDEHARKFLTASAPTGQSDIAPALVQQGLQPIMLKRQRFNPSRLVKNFRQGSVKDAGHSGQALVCWSTTPARTPRPKRSPVLVAACWRRESVQSLSRMRPSALDGFCRPNPLCIGPGQARPSLGRTRQATAVYCGLMLV